MSTPQLPEAAGAADALATVAGTTEADIAAAVDQLAITAITIGQALRDAAGAVDGLKVYVTPKASQLVDTFAGPALNSPLWVPFGAGAITSAGGTLSLTDVASLAASTGVNSRIVYDLVSSAVFVQLASAGVQRSTTQAVLLVQLDLNHTAALIVNNNSLIAQYQITGTYTTLNSAAYNAVTMKWLRLREAGGTLFYEYSANGISWTTLASQADPFALNALTITIQEGQYGGADPASTSLWSFLNVLPTTVAPVPIASPAFILSRMPRMHVQNLLTGGWWHRDVQGVTSPSITWALNTADTFTCSLAPPRPDMMDSSGNALLLEWRDAIYLEENDEIKFGGIVTNSTMQGPTWQLTATGFAGYANGMPYEGANVSRTNIDALDAVRLIWSWLQSQPGGDIKLLLGGQKAGYLLGAQHPPGASAVLGSFGPFRQGATFVWLTNAQAFQAGNVITINGDQYTIKTVEMTAQNVASGKVDLTTPLRTTYQSGMPVIQLQAVVPWTLNWWNGTDCGQEVQSIQQEAIFDYREQHVWQDATKGVVKHNLLFGVPRLGGRLQNLRFCEGENIVQAVQVTRDGSKYANDVIGLGAGQGSSQIHTQAANASTGRLRRSYIYTDQTCNTVARIATKAYKILGSMQNIDTVTQIVVRNHPNAPWGSFMPGDDIPVMLASGWRNTTIWSRITQMTQDPTTDLMTLTLARSDSFTYMPQTGVAGTL